MVPFTMRPWGYRSGNSILRHGECVSGQINAGRCCLIPNSIKKHFYFFNGGGSSVIFWGIALGTDRGVRVGGVAGVVKNNQGDR